MIKDRLKNAQCYYSLSKGIMLGFDWLKNTDLMNIEDGRYDISNGIYANVQSYDTKKEALFEAHREYIDIQYMIDGAEGIGVCDYSKCETVEPYDKNRDIEFLNSKWSDFISLHTGEFVLLYPQDAHKPSMNLDKQHFVKKVVVKVHI